MIVPIRQSLDLAGDVLGHCIRGHHQSRAAIAGPRRGPPGSAPRSSTVAATGRCLHGGLFEQYHFCSTARSSEASATTRFRYHRATRRAIGGNPQIYVSEHWSFTKTVDDPSAVPWASDCL